MSSEAVEKALDEVVQKIVEGARPLGTDPKIQAMFRQKYRPDFEAHESSWPEDRPKVLRLARVVGHLASFLTSAWASLNQAEEKPTPTEVDARCADLAGWLVSRTICPPPGATPFRGRHCKSYTLGLPEGPGLPRPPVDLASLEMAAEIARVMLRRVLPPLDSGPLVR